MSDVHPSVGERKSREDMIRFWDEYSDQYTAVQQGDIPQRIVSRLFELGSLHPNDCVLEIGSGPGTYSMVLAPKVRILTCMDTSPNMLKRLKAEAVSRGIGNIECFLKDWGEYVPKKGYDACIATLCPGSGTPESIVRMEGAARRSCTLVSWVDNHGDDLNSMIWNELGKDYGYGFRHSTQVEDWLAHNGRDPLVEFFDADVSMDVPISSIIAQEESSFRAYGVDADIPGLVRKVLADSLDGDILHYSATNRMKMITWSAERRRHFP